MHVNTYQVTIHVKTKSTDYISERKAKYTTSDTKSNYYTSEKTIKIEEYNFRRSAIEFEIYIYI